MPDFGRRGTSAARPVRAAFKAGSPPNLSTALEVIEQGKLPYWANIGFSQLVISTIVVAVAYMFVILPYTGNIWRDHRLAGSWQVAYDMRAMDGKCTRHFFVLTTCNAKIKSLADPGQDEVSVSFMMGFTSGDGEQLIPVRSSVDPSVVTIGYAANTELWNRTVTLILMTLGAAASLLASACLLLQGRYKGGAAYLELEAGLASLQTRTAPAV